MLGYYDGGGEYYYSYQGQFDDDETEEKFKKAKYKGKINMYDNNGLPVGTKVVSKYGKRIEIYDNCGKPIGYEDIDEKYCYVSTLMTMLDSGQE